MRHSQLTVCGPIVGCIGMPYLPPPIYYRPARPLDYYPPPNLRLPDLADPYPAPVPPPPQPVQAAPPRRGGAPPKDAEAQGIERDITDFCSTHPDENFCVRLNDYLERHPERRPPK